jgi:hypothetical protein
MLISILLICSAIISIFAALAATARAIEPDWDVMYWEVCWEVRYELASERQSEYVPAWGR